MYSVKKGSLVQIHQIILKPEERAPQVPEDTRQVPLELWVKGILQQDANIGDIVLIETMTGRKITGELVAVNPPYTHGYGQCIPELVRIDRQLKEMLYGGVK